MKIPVLFIGLLVFICSNSFCQNPFPVLDSNALVSGEYGKVLLQKPYTIIVYGSIGCGYSKYLVDNLNGLNQSRSKADIIIIMAQPKDTILRYMDSTSKLYPVFSNAVLQYKLKKHSDRFPHLILFKNGVQRKHILGIKKGILRKVNDIILNDK
jgi:hypothetical protein